MLSLKQIQKVVIESKKLYIVGNKNSLKFQTIKDNQIDMSQYSGVIEYYPEELVITVKAGTTVKALNQILAEKKQVTSFYVSDEKSATIGGAYARGSADLRDAVLGIKIVDGQGRLLTFGGQVMKNVAGYDVARLLVGSKGLFAVICEISFKVIPESYKPQTKKPISQPAHQPNNLFIKSNQNKETSAFKKDIEHKLKNIFDPKNIFI